MNAAYLYLALAVSFLAGVSGQITFTGNAAKDFNVSTLTSDQLSSYFAFFDGRNLGPSFQMQSQGWVSGFDIISVYFQYDWRNDILNVGIECDGVCGDADGDGNPDTSPVGFNQVDRPRMCDGEQVSLLIWPEPPTAETGANPPWVPMQLPAGLSPTQWEARAWFFPQIIVGVDDFACLDDDFTPFGAYEFNGWSECKWPDAYFDPFGFDCDQMRRRVSSLVDAYSFSISDKLDEFGNKYIPPVDLFALPSLDKPHLEFRMANFSRYPGFSFRPGVDPITFGFSFYSGSAVDDVGEDRVNPAVFSIPCAIKDGCGVCGGDNSTCWGCDRVPNSGKVYDGCGVCDGDNSTCWGCDKIPNSGKVYDDCGVCDGDNSTCWGCDKVPNSGKVYDGCGVCDGDNSTCWGCDKIPNSGKVYDGCGVCDGDNSTCWGCDKIPNSGKVYDGCGVCDGDNSTCWGCDKIPNSGKVYDSCGVCGGDNSTCTDCFGIPNGPNRYDLCGVCAGDNTTCADCFGIPNGPNIYDLCGVCAGDNTSCADCFGIPNGPNRYDLCGVCAGDNTTCADCFGVPNGPSKYDLCGVCAGDNTTCADCFGVPNGPAELDICGDCEGGNVSCSDCFGIPFGGAVYDGCGVCGGDNSTCWGCDKVPNSGKKYDLCGVCDGDGAACSCLSYLGSTLCEVDYALLRWSIGASLVKFNDSLDVLYAIKNELPFYDYRRELLRLDDFIDTIHDFCDDCLDLYDHAQYWFADLLVGHYKYVWPYTPVSIGKYRAWWNDIPEDE